MNDTLEIINVSKISVDLDNPNFIQDDESIVLYESIITQTNECEKRKNSIKNKSKTLKNSNSKPIISKKIPILLNRKEIKQNKEIKASNKKKIKF